MIRYRGDIVQVASGSPAEGIRVEFFPIVGARLKEPVLTAVTDQQGRFELSGFAEDEGEVIGNLIFYPPSPIEPVLVEDIRLSTSRTEGEIRFAGRWAIPYPHLPYQVAFYSRETGVPAVGIELEFQRTGGIEVDPDTFRVTTNSFGTAKLRPRTDTVGELVGDLVVVPLPPYRPYRIANLRMATFATARFDSTIVYAGLGPHLPYAGTLVFAGTGQRAEGVVLELRRTGGVPIQPATFTSTTDRFGTFYMSPVPLAEGELQADLVVRSPAQFAGRVVSRLRLATRVIEGVQYLGFFEIPPR